MANFCIFCIAISKLGYWQEFKINKSIKIDIYNTVLTLCLAVNLKNKGNKKFLLNIKKILKQ